MSEKLGAEQTDRSRADAVFLAALERPRPEWSAFVEEACGDDSELRRTVFALLQAHEQTGPLDRLGGELPALWAQVAGGESVIDEGRSAAPGTPAFTPGSVLGRYEIRERLGAGGMGEVFRAFDPRLQREVAVKVIACQIHVRPEMLRRFEEEARAASALSHPWGASRGSGGSSRAAWPRPTSAVSSTATSSPTTSSRRLRVSRRSWTSGSHSSGPSRSSSTPRRRSARAWSGRQATWLRRR